MELDVYCDESQTDIFCTKSSPAKFLVLGSLWVHHERREELKLQLHELRNQHKIGPEFKWSKISSSRKDFYLEFLNWFFGQGLDVRYRCILVPKASLDLVKFHQSDAELGFYKFYYQLLHHWIRDFNTYRVFCDYKRDRLSDRLETLKSCLSNSNITSEIASLQWVRSEESVLIQAVDVLTGAVSAKMNGTLTHGTIKDQFITELERKLGPNSIL